MNLGQPKTSKESEQTLSLKKPETVEAEVREYFKDESILIEIAHCESRFRHVRQNGNIFRGVENDKDVGVMQINEDYHLQTAQKLDYDIYTLHGNMAYARYLYEREGAQPWVHSGKCWKKAYTQEMAMAGKLSK